MNWRELFGRLIEVPAEKQRIAELLGVRPFTLTRWVNGEVEPRQRYLRKVPDLFPEYRKQLIELMQDEFPDMSFEIELAVDAFKEVPLEYYARILRTYATDTSSLWSISHLGLSQVLHQVDPNETGIEVAFVRCVPPRNGQKVRSLWESLRIGSPPFGDERMIDEFIFLGAESLAGYAISGGYPGIVQDIEEGRGMVPVRVENYERSAVAYPFLRGGRVAGCLRVSSVQPNFFVGYRLALLEQHANLLALSFADTDFYTRDDVALSIMPASEVQREYIARAKAQRRALQTMLAYLTAPMPQAEAQVRVLQQIEAELIGLCSQEYA